jgi:hypothetical protein
MAMIRIRYMRPICARLHISRDWTMDVPNVLRRITGLE